MPRYRYRALDPEGLPRQGELHASSSEAVASQLHKRGLMVLQVKAAGAGLWRLGRGQGLSASELVNFTQQLAILLGAGLPLDQALGVLINQPGAQGSATRGLLERIRERVKAGQPLSSAMGEEDGQFSALYIGLVRAGEAGGALEETLGQLTDYLERSQALRGEVINALIYPAFLVVGVLGSLVLLLSYVVPQFVPIFRDLGVPVPLITEVILNLGQFFSRYGLLLLGGLAFAAWLLPAALRNPARRVRWDRRLIGLPVLGPLLQRLEAARLARTLGTLLHNGVALLGALAIARQACSNRALQAQLAGATEEVKEGGSLAYALSRDSLLPHLAVQMIQVGEQAGQLDAMLLKVASVFDTEARRSIARLLAALVPTLTIVMAVLVAVIMLAIMLPLMSLTSNI